jgi:hypothetical protein
MEISEETLIQMLASAYKRGAEWMQQNNAPEFVVKAANDYADATVSQL